MPDEDLAKSYEMKETIKKFSKKLQKNGFTNPFQVQQILDTIKIPSFDDLTSIDRSWSESSDIQDKDLDTKAAAAEVWKLLKETRVEFLNVIVRYKPETDLKEVCLHPMDVLYHIFRNAQSEASRILVENLDKMKIAYPIVIPSNNEKPRLQIWPLKSISRQTNKSKFNIFSNDHHVIACVRLSDSDTLPKRFSVHSKSDFLNQIFFRGQHRFISRNHPGFTNQNGLKQMRRINDGAIESTTYTPNNSSKSNELNSFFEIWNLSGNISYSGLQPQINLIKSAASSIIVFVDNDKNLEMKEKQIIETFGSNSKVAVLVLDRNLNDSSDSSDSEEDHPKQSFSSGQIKLIQYRANHKEESFQLIRRFVGKCLDSNPKFSFTKLIEEQSSLAQDFLREFEIDMNNTIIQQSIALVNEMGDKLKKLVDKHPNGKVQEIVFPIYFSLSPLDKTKKIVEHIEFLNDNKVKLFNMHQRAEFQQDNEIDEKINFLRKKQIVIAGRSQFVHIYLNHINDITIKSEPKDKKEWIRIYHKLLAYKLSTFAIEGLDTVGFQRELGQLYISKNTKRGRKLKLRPKIITCLQQLISAGVSVELVDGDTQNVNKEIILHLLQKIE